MSDSQHPEERELPISSITPSYDTGHGDFCFGRWMAKERFRSRPDDTDSPANPPWTDEEMLAGSHNTAFSEMGSFVRSGSFPWNKLPTEIRERIIRIIIAPLYSNTQFESSVRINVFRDRDHDLTLRRFGYEGSYIEYQERTVEQELVVTDPRNFGWVGLHLGGMVAENGMTETQYLKGQKSVQRMLEQHPHRSSPYTISILTSRHVNPAGFEGGDLGFIRLVRLMSQVSHQFRAELGSVIWARTQITFHCYSTLEIFTTQSFFLDRPAITSGIKSIKIACCLTKFVGEVNYRALLTRLFVSLSSAMAFEYFTLRLTLSEVALQEPLNNTDHWKAFKVALRDLKTKHFIFGPSLLSTYEGLTDLEEYWDYRYSLERKHGSKIRSFLLPDCLRSKEAQTDIEKYLSSRTLERPVKERDWGMEYMINEVTDSEEEDEEDEDDEEEESE